MLQLSNILPCAAGGLAICAATISDSKLQKTLPSSNKDSYSLLNLDSYSKWRMSFIAGYMFVSTLLWSIFGTDEINMIGMKLFESQEDFLSGISSFGFLISGFLMGAGAKLAHGGITKFAFHGIPTGSKRAIIGLALIFGVASLITAFRAHHSFYDEEDLEDFAKGFNPKFALLAPVILLLVSFIKTEAKVRDIMMSFGTGSLFSLGVILSGLAQRHRMIQSMTFNKTWDPFLLYVVAVVTIVNVLLGFAKRYREIEKKSLALNVDSKFILGCCFMGAGLGISGLTPGSALVLTPLYLPQVGLFFLPFVALGQFCAQPMGEWMIKEMHIDSKTTDDSKKD